MSIEYGLVPPLHFIISPGRSGSTFLRKHLIERTNIHIPPESASFIIDVARSYKPKSKWADNVKMALSNFDRLSLNEYWQLDLHDLEKYLLKIEKKRGLAALLLGFYKFHGKVYKPSAKIFADKTPYLSQNLKWLQVIFPSSGYLYLFRDPYEVTFSRVRNFNELLLLAANKWLWAEKEYNRVKSLLRIKLVFYELLVDNLDEEINQIVTFFSADYLSRQEKVFLGEEHLNHHKKLSQGVQKFTGANFSKSELTFLRKHFLRIRSKSIRHFYGIE